MIELNALQVDWFGVFANPTTFLMTMIAIVGGITGAIAQKLTLAGMASFIAFVYVSMETDLFIFDGMLYVFITILLFVLSVRVYKMIYGDTGDAGV